MSLHRIPDRPFLQETVEVLRLGMEHYILYSDVPNGPHAHPWCNANGYRAEAQKLSAVQVGIDARLHKAPNTRNVKKAFNKAVKEVQMCNTQGQVLDCEPMLTLFQQTASFFLLKERLKSNQTLIALLYHLC